MLKNWTWFEKLWLPTFVIIGAALSYVWGDTFFGYSVFLTGIICVVLVSRGSVWNYSFGIYNTAGYTWIAWQNGFFGEVLLNGAFYTPVQIMGWIMWNRNIDHAREENDIVVMKKLGGMRRMQLFLLCFIAIGLFNLVLAAIPGQNMPLMDSTTTILSVIAMILMMLRYAEQWFLWITVDVLYIIMWSLRLESGTEGAMAMLVMWSAYLINAIYGCYKWNKQALIVQE